MDKINNLPIYNAGSPFDQLPLINYMGGNIQPSNLVTVITLARINPIDDPTGFVTQNYLDFLNRQPDQAELNFWVNQIASCNGDATCIDNKRQNVSAAYFLSREFQETGFFVIEVQRVAFGKLSNDPTKRVTFQQFVADSQAVGKNFIDGQTGADQILDQNKTNYAQQITGRSAFISKYPTTLSASAYVGTLFATAGVAPQETERQDAINAFGAGDTAGRAAALRKVAESNSVNKLNSFGGDYIQSQMVRSFILSSEYRERFSSIP